MDDRAKTRQLVDESPEMASHLETVLEVDSDTDSWTFDDVPVDSGVFGEIVSRGLVEKTGDGEYELSAPEAVAAVVNEDSDAMPVDDAGGVRRRFPSVRHRSRPTVDRREVATLLGVLSLVGIFRLFPYPSVFRNGDVVLSGNDPYFYRYLVGEMLSLADGPFDLGVLSNVPVPHGEPLLVATLWWVTALLGGGERTAGLVLAWYPMVSAVVSGIFLYLLAIRLTDDRRVGLATVGALAVMPIHATRTGLGFADHHAFDLVWLSLTALLLVLISDRELSNVKTWLLAIGIGGAVGAQTLAWEAGPLLLVPIGIYVAVRVLADVRDDTSPATENVPLVVGLGVSAVLVYLVHLELGWHTEVVASAPLLLFVGVLGSTGVAEIVYRIDGSVQLLAGIESVGAIAGIVVFPILFPTVSESLDRGVEFLIGTTGIAETRPLFAESLGGIVAPLFHFGFLLLLALPYMVWTAWHVYRGGDSRWLVPLSYGWPMFFLALIQIRFGSQLALFTAVFAGLGFVHLASWVDLAESPELMSGSSSVSNNRQLPSPGRRHAIRLTGLSLGVGGLGAILTPIEHGQITIGTEQYRAARFLERFAEERDWTYPGNYVLSPWGTNRFYNWFVNGEARTYGFARRTYPEFVRSTDGEQWYERLHDRVGFIVLSEEDSPTAEGTETLHEQLLGDGFGIETDHYRALWMSESDSLRAYTLVPGAVLTGKAEPNSTQKVSVSADIGERSISATMNVSVSEQGRFRERVPLPGTYTIGESSVRVTETDVVDGRSKSLSLSGQ